MNAIHTMLKIKKNTVNIRSDPKLFRFVSLHFISFSSLLPNLDTHDEQLQTIYVGHDPLSDVHLDPSTSE